jgi:hypothetical protein
MIYYAMRGIRIVRVLNDPEIRDGKIWINGVPLLGITDDASKAIAADACRRRAWDEIPEEYYCRIGVNSNGVTVVSREDYRRAEWENLPQAEKEYIEIERIFLQSYRRETDSDDDNVYDALAIRSRAQHMMNEWMKKYPKEAEEKEKEKGGEK